MPEGILLRLGIRRLQRKLGRKANVETRAQSERKNVGGGVRAVLTPPPLFLTSSCGSLSYFSLSTWPGLSLSSLRPLAFLSADTVVPLRLAMTLRLSPDLTVTLLGVDFSFFVVVDFLSPREEDFSLRLVDFSLRLEVFSLRLVDFSLRLEDFSLRLVDFSLRLEVFSSRLVDF